MKAATTLLVVIIIAGALLAFGCGDNRDEIVGCVKPGVEAGCIVLITDSGQTFTLIGNRPTSGYVRVFGQERKDMASVCMQGAIFEVTRFEVIPTFRACDQ